VTPVTPAADSFPVPARVYPGMPLELPQAARDLLDGPHTAILATANADGRPQSSVIFVRRDGDTVLFSTIRGRLKTRNMERDPRVSLLALAHAGRYVEIRGRVDITDDPEKALLHEMYERHMGGATPPSEPDAERVIVRVHPEKVWLWPPLPVAAPEGRTARA
jgi:PPOX class probable F420-dependent enzyme